MKEKKEPLYYKTVLIPHIRTTIHFMDLSKLKGIEVKGAGYTTVFEDTFAEDGRTKICIFLQDIEKNTKEMQYAPYIAHEIMHALQIICMNLGMKIEEEQEHTAYLMHYIMEELISTK